MYHCIFCCSFSPLRCLWTTICNDTYKSEIKVYNNNYPAFSLFHSHPICPFPSLRSLSPSMPILSPASSLCLYLSAPSLPCFLSLPLCPFPSLLSFSPSLPLSPILSLPSLPLSLLICVSPFLLLSVLFYPLSPALITLVPPHIWRSSATSNPVCCLSTLALPYLNGRSNIAIVLEPCRHSGRVLELGKTCHLVLHGLLSPCCQGTINNHETICCLSE